MPILDAECSECNTEKEVIVFKNRHRNLRLYNCDKCGKATIHKVVDRHYASALRFVDGVSQWESNSKRAKQLREGKH